MANEVQVPELGVAQANPKVAVTRPQNDASFIETMGNVAGGLIQGVQTFRTKRAASREAEALDAARTLQDYGLDVNRQGQVVGSPEARARMFQEGVDIEEVQRQVNTVQKQAGDSFRALRNVMEQGGTKSGIALAQSRIESEMNRISAMFPGFNDVVRQTARSTLGFDPTGSTLRRVFEIGEEEDERELTPYEQTVRNLEAASRGRVQIGKAPYSQEYIHKLAHDVHVIGAEDQAVTNRLSVADGTAETVFSDWFDRREKRGGGLNFATYVDRALTGVATGKIKSMSDTESAKLVIQSTMTDYLDEFEQAMSDAGKPITSDQREKFRLQLEKRWAPTIEFLENTENLKLLENYSTVIEEQMQIHGFRNMPKISYMKEVGGESMLSAYFDILKSTKDVRQASLLFQKYPELFSYVQFDAEGESDPNNIRHSVIANGYDNVFNGAQHSITGNPKTDRQAELLSLQTALRNSRGNSSQNNELANRALNNRPDMTVTALVVDPDMWNGLDESNKQKARETFAGKTFVSLNNLYGEIDNPSKTRASINEDGQIVIDIVAETDPRTGMVSRPGRTVTSDSSPSLQWLNRVGAKAFESRTLAEDFGKNIFNGKIRNKEEYVRFLNDSFKAQTALKEIEKYDEQIRELRDYDIDMDDEKVAERKRKIEKIRSGKRQNAIDTYNRIKQENPFLRGDTR